MREVDIKEHGEHDGHVHEVYDTDGASAPYREPRHPPVLILLFPPQRLVRESLIRLSTQLLPEETPLAQLVDDVVDVLDKSRMLLGLENSLN